MNRSRRLLVQGSVLAAVAALTGCDRFGGGGEGRAASGFHSIDITGADYGRQLSLPDHNGKVRTLDDFKGKVAVVFFGFTQCPDVCPTTMAELAQIKQSLGTDGERIQGVFITVDPERDTPEILGPYVTSFDPSFIALRGTLEQTTAAAKDFKVFFKKVDGKTPGSYTMDHTAGAYVFDTQGRLRLFTRYGSGTEALASDLKQLLAAG